MVSAGVVLLASAAVTAFNGMWALSGMDAFAGAWNRRLQPSAAATPAAAPTQDELFTSLNVLVGHHLSRMIVWSLAVPGLTGATLLVGSFVARPAFRRSTAEPTP